MNSLKKQERFTNFSLFTLRKPLSLFDLKQATGVTKFFVYSSLTLKQICSKEIVLNIIFVATKKHSVNTCHGH